MSNLDEVVLAWEENLGGHLTAGNHLVSITDIVIEPKRDGKNDLRLVYSNNLGKFNDWVTYKVDDPEDSWKSRKGKEVIMKIRDVLGITKDLILKDLLEDIGNQQFAIALRATGETRKGFEQLKIEEFAATTKELPPLPASIEAKAKENKFAD
tara:strand:- start:579 stop:1037 length:459 start_codon:yes stop_codon:yes gene_type:complete